MGWWGTVVGIGLGLVTLWVVLVAVLWFLRPRDTSLGELIRFVPDLIGLVRQLLRDRTVRFGVRAALAGLLLWLLSPIDLVPEFIPVLGPLDDVIVAVLVLRYARRRLGDEEIERRWPGTPQGYRLLHRLIGGRPVDR
jgi:uncharacterized membrane protein YkvA (DUF1232 family)